MLTWWTSCSRPGRTGERVGRGATTRPYLLHAAVEGGNEQVISSVMKAGAKEDMNTKTTSKERTPLHLATRGGKVPVAKVLMLAGADVNILDADGDGPLHLAIKVGLGDLTENLLLRGADPNAKGYSGFFPIHFAARRGQDEVVRNLLHAGAEVNRLTDGGWTPLNHTVWSNHTSTVKVLLGAAADTNIPCNGRRPLHIAVRKNNTDILAALVEAGADIEARGRHEQTPLHESAFFGSYAAMLALLQRGADAHAKKDTTKSTPLHLACQQGKVDAADLLLRWGADETTLDKNGRTPIARIPNIAEAAEHDRPRLERLSRLLASAPQDRAWRRRGMLVLCRAFPDRRRRVVEIPDTAGASGQPQERPSRRPRRGQVKVEVTMGGARGGGGGTGSSASSGRRAAREGSGGDRGGGGGFDGVAAWLVALTEEDVFRTIVGFL